MVSDYLQRLLTEWAVKMNAYLELPVVDEPGIAPGALDLLLIHGYSLFTKYKSLFQSMNLVNWSGKGVLYMYKFDSKLRYSRIHVSWLRIEELTNVVGLAIIRKEMRARLKGHLAFFDHETISNSGVRLQKDGVFRVRFDLVA